MSPFARGHTCTPTPPLFISRALGDLSLCLSDWEQEKSDITLWSWLKGFSFFFFFFSIMFIEIAVCYWPSESQDHWVLSRFLQKQKGGSGIVSYLEPSIWRWVVVLRITGAYRRCNWTTIHLGCVLFYSSFSQPCHISMCAMWAPSDVRCRFLEHFFLGLSCFGSGAAGLSPPGRSALASVPELHVSSFRHATWLNFADFLLFWWFLCVSHPVIHNSLCHRRLACTCRDSQLFRGFGKQFVWSFLSMILLG